MLHLRRRIPLGLRSKDLVHQLAIIFSDVKNFKFYSKLLLESVGVTAYSGFLAGCTWEVLPGTSLAKMGLSSSLTSSRKATLYDYVT